MIYKILASFTIIAGIIEINAKLQTKPLPSYVTRACYEDDPNLGKCIVEVGSAAIKSVAQGDPEYRIPRLEPFVIPELAINHGTKQIGMSLICRNCTMYGLENTRLVNVKPDMVKRKAKWYFELDQLLIKGKYNVSGQVLLLPISGNGECKIIPKNVKFLFDFSWNLTKKSNGFTYAKVDKHKLTFDVGDMTLYLENLFNGNKLLGDNMNIFLNENWKEIMKEVSPVIAQVLGDLFKTILNRMSALVPFEYQFPKTPKSV